MSVLYVLLPLALLMAAAAVVAFVWAVRRGQLDDLETPAMRMLADEDAPPQTGRGEAKGNHSERGDGNAGGDGRADRS